MNTPTEAHYDLRRLVIYSDADEGAELIAESEARAVAAAVTALTCTHHNDKQWAECPVCLVTHLTVERDHWQKIAVSASHEREHNANVAQAMTTERDQLRAEVDQKRNLLVIALRSAGDQETRASRAETELATERARLDWFHEAAGDSIWVASQDIRAAIDAAMKRDVLINSPLDARP